MVSEVMFKPEIQRFSNTSYHTFFAMATQSENILFLFFFFFHNPLFQYFKDYLVKYPMNVTIPSCK